MEYDAFISYSHAADGRLAPAVQSGLHRMARPWWRIRALRVFRDETGLSVNPGLWNSIETALRSSEWFVLLCSPEAAASPWVNKEIETWVETMPAERILPVLTDGTITWEPNTGDFTADSTAIPPALRARYREAPRYLDLRWARTETQLDLRNSRFRAGIATIAAPIHGVTRDELDSEDVRLHRGVMRLARVVVATVATLLVLLGVASATIAGARSESHRLKSVIAKLSSADAKLSNLNRELQAQQVATRNANAQLSRANDDLNRQKGIAILANSKLSKTNITLVGQKRAAADLNRKLLGTNNALESQQHATEKANGRLSNANAKLTFARGRVVAGNTKLRKTNATLIVQERLTEQLRQAVVARQLALDSRTEADAGAKIPALLLAAQAERFATRSNGLIPAADLRSALVNALESNAVAGGWPTRSVLRLPQCAQPCGVATALSPSGRILASVATTGASGGSLQLRALDGSRPELRISLDQRPATPAADDPTTSAGDRSQTLVFDDQADEVAVANSGGSVDVFDVATGARQFHVTPPHLCSAAASAQNTCSYPNLAFSGSFRNGRLAEVFDGRLTTWALRLGKVVTSRNIDLGGAYAYGPPALSDSGARLVVATDSALSDSARIFVLVASPHGWTLVTIFELRRPTDWAVSPDGTKFVAVDNNSTIGVDLISLRKMWVAPGDASRVWFGTDGSLYTASAVTGKIFVRSPVQGSVEYVVDSTTTQQATGVSPDALAFNGSHLLAAFVTPADSEIVVADYAIAMPDLVSAACHEAGRSLSRVEWQRYVGPFDAYERTCSRTR